MLAKLLSEFDLPRLKLLLKFLSGVLPLSRRNLLGSQAHFTRYLKKLIVRDSGISLCLARQAKDSFHFFLIVESLTGRHVVCRELSSMVGLIGGR